MKLFYPIIILNLCFISCVTTVNNSSDSVLRPKPFIDYESRSDELTGETNDYYVVRNLYIKNSRKKIALTGDERLFKIHFNNRFLRQNANNFNGKDLSSYLYQASLATIEFHSSLSEGRATTKAYLEIDSLILPISMDLKIQSNEAKEEITQTQNTTTECQQVWIPEKTESQYNPQTNKFEDVIIPGRFETIQSPVTTITNTSELKHSIFNQFTWKITDEFRLKMIHARSIRLKLHLENNDFWAHIPDYKMNNLKRFLQHDYRDN